MPAEQSESPHTFGVTFPFTREGRRQNGSGVSFHALPSSGNCRPSYQVKSSAKAGSAANATALSINLTQLIATVFYQISATNTKPYVG